MRATRRAGLVSVTLLVILVGCGDRSSPLDAYDPAEIAFLRQDAIANQVELDDESLLSMLQFRSECRVLLRGLARAEVGDPLVDDEVRQLPHVTRQTHGQPELAAGYEQLISAAEQGDLAPIRQFVDSSCQGVTLDPARS